MPFAASSTSFPTPKNPENDVVVMWTRLLSRPYGVPPPCAETSVYINQAETLVAGLNGARERQVDIADDVAETRINSGRRLAELFNLSRDPRDPYVRACTDRQLCRRRVRLLAHQPGGLASCFRRARHGISQCHAQGNQRAGNRFHGSLAQSMAEPECPAFFPRTFLPCLSAPGV